MRFMFAAAIALAAPVSMVHAAEAGSTTAAAAAPYSAANTEIGVLLDDPAAKAVLEKVFPGMTTNPQIDMARAMTMKGIQQYNPEMVTDEKLAELDAELAKLKK